MIFFSNGIHKHFLSALSIGQKKWNHLLLSTSLFFNCQHPATCNRPPREYIFILPSTNNRRSQQGPHGGWSSTMVATSSKLGADSNTLLKNQYNHIIIPFLSVLQIKMIDPYSNTFFINEIFLP